MSVIEGWSLAVALAAAVMLWCRLDWVGVVGGAKNFDEYDPEVDADVD